MGVHHKIVTNTTWLICCRVIQAVVNLAISMMTARYFGPSNYGAIHYAASVVAFFIPVMQLGLRSTLVQEFIDHPDREGTVLGTSILMNVLSGLLCMVGVLLFAVISGGNEKETILVCVLYSTVLLFQATEMIQYWFQSKLLSKYTAIISLCAYLAVSIYKMILMGLSKSVYWFALSNSFDGLLVSIGLFAVYNRMAEQKLAFSFKMARNLFSRSKFYIISSLMVVFLGQVGNIILKAVHGKEAVGYYTAAITCAAITGFAFNALIDSARPVILAYRQTDREKYQESIEGLYAVVIWASILQSVLICLFAGVIMGVLYGSAFAAAVGPLRIICWYSVFSYLGPIRNIWILAENKQKYLWIVNLLGAVFSIVANLLLISALGVIGAAIATVITQIFTNIVVSGLIKPLKESNDLMRRGLDPRKIVGFVKMLKK